MTISDSILDARENRSHQINQLTKQYTTVVSIRVNFPGKDKHHQLAYLIFYALKLSDLDTPIEYKTYCLNNGDGPYILLASNDDGKAVKEKTVRFENNLPLGRFYDIDVYDKNHTHERKQKRVCFLCQQMAHICIRDKRHSYEELYQHIYEHTMDDYRTSLIHMIDEAMTRELDLDPKFGLVTKVNDGSHSDMNYALMIKAKDALMPYLIQIFDLSIYIQNPFEDVIDEFIAIGKAAESTMYQVTNNVNCYKGLIFHLGLIVMAYGYHMSRPKGDSFQLTLKTIAKVLINHLENENTFGYQAYQNHQIHGAKGEALSGYEHAIQVKHLYNTNQLMERLVHLIIEIEDTNLLKRAGSLETYHTIKQWFVELDTSDQKAVDALSERCIKKGLSFGGSADLLVVSIFFDLLEKKHDNIYL